MRSKAAVFLAILFMARAYAASGASLTVDVDVSQYKHWPEHTVVPVGQVRPQAWRNSNHIMEGWDWSLPPHVTVKPNSLLCISRSLNTMPKLNFPANPVISVWIYWSDLEPEEDVYRFDKLRDMLKRVEAAGYSAVIRPMTAAYKRPNHPDPAGTPAGRMRSCPPTYLVTKYDVPLVYEKPKNTWRIVNLDVSHPAYHKRYVRFVTELGRSGIPRLDVVKGFIVGYKSASWGDEGIGPRGETKGGEEPQHVKERLDAWAEACRGVEYKVCMGGISDYGLAKGFGIRSGFVEMYLYHIPDPYIGQALDDSGYLVVNESAPIITHNSFSGEENEEYDRRWTFRFGKIESFVYRYFVSNLRVIQMRRNYLLHNPFSVYPDMLPYVSLEMGRTIKDTPDVWCALRESYIRGRGEHSRSGMPVKNFERWLHQRNSAGYEAEPAVKMAHPIRMWMVHGNKKTGEGKYYDFAARRGKRIGFDIDNRFLNRSQRVAVKITYFDVEKGRLTLRHSRGRESVHLVGDGKVRTATLFCDGFTGSPVPGSRYDLIISGEPEAVVSFVRVVKTR